jgi:excisionase family DNA binding protein
MAAEAQSTLTRRVERHDYKVQAAGARESRIEEMLDRLLENPERIRDLPQHVLQDLYIKISQRNATLKALESQILWRLLSDRSDEVQSDGFPRLLTARQLAEQLSVPESWLREKARIGELPSVKLGHYVRFCLDDVRRYLSEIAPERSLFAQTALPAGEISPPQFANRSLGSQSESEAAIIGAPWPPSKDIIGKTAWAEIADVLTAWIIVLRAHVVHESGFISQLRRRLKNISPRRG